MVARLYLPGELPSQDHSLAQIESARANNCIVSGYLWAYKSFDPRQSIRDAVTLARHADLDLSSPVELYPELCIALGLPFGTLAPALWIDCETYNPTGQKIEDPGPDASWLREAVDECHILGVQAAIYSAAWWWNDPAYMAGSTEFAHLPLWVGPPYDGVQGLAHVKMFGGWTQAHGKQYAVVETGIPGVKLDLDVFRPEVT